MLRSGGDARRPHVKLLALIDIADVADGISAV
jgi:hypothetical protein